MSPPEHIFQLPSRLETHLATLECIFRRDDETLLRRIVVNAIPSVDEGREYDNWDGGVHGHAVTLSVPEEIYSELGDEKQRVEHVLHERLKQLNSLSDEYYCSVFVEMLSDSQDDWRSRSGELLPRSSGALVPADALTRIWGESKARVFLSHKSTIKKDAAELKGSLARCGIAAFVAHEDIEPTEQWHREIEYALSSMDALAALLTSDFHDSNWTDQEVGFALGRGVPLIPIGLGMDPYGLMGKAQALRRCTIEDAPSLAAAIFRLLCKRLPKAQMFECALSGYAGSTSCQDSGWRAKTLLTPFETLDEPQVERVLHTYRRNKENRNSFDAMNVLVPLLQNWTGNRWEIRDNEIVRA